MKAAHNAAIRRIIVNSSLDAGALFFFELPPLALGPSG
jgi:hypothetical protein